ncbi:unnamed protein product [Closterium sp. Naga37s-1]|nr:unnamed protein product [Closterium sp. Naga37s-1]
MPRFSSDPGAQKSPERVDASFPAADAQAAAAGAGTFLRPTPPRSPREASSAALGFRHRRWHSFSGFQELPGECGVCGTPESVDGAYDGDITSYPPRAPCPSTVAVAAASAATAAAAAASSSPIPTPAVAAQYSVPPAAAAAAATSPPPSEAMWPRSQFNGSLVLHALPTSLHGRTVTAWVMTSTLSWKAVSLRGRYKLSEVASQWPFLFLLLLLLLCLLVAVNTPLSSSPFSSSPLSSSPLSSFPLSSSSLSSSPLSSSLVSAAPVRALILKAHLSTVTIETHL